MNKKIRCYLKICISSFLILLVIIFTTFSFVAIKTRFISSKGSYTIVIDAGHGGRDGGSVGKNRSVEKELNLKYAKKLKDKLKDKGYNVVMTRENDNGLYSMFASNKKISDMNERMKIIKKANPNLVISIHMNSFNDSSVRGANTYFKIDDDASENCATCIQKSLNTYCDAPNLLPKKGDYFMLNCSYYTSILIECGFISNPQEELLLSTDEYCEKFTDAITKGVLLYFGQ